MTMDKSKGAASSLLLKDVAYNEIKESILNEKFEPGRFLSERELIELLGMSKTPIKAALTRLETEGFVTVSSKQGIIINDLSVNRIVDIYDLRIALETFNCQQIESRLTPEQEKELEGNLAETADIVSRLDVKNFAQADHDFHLIICECTGNQEIHRVLLNYHDHLQRITRRHLRKDPHRMEKFLEDHWKIYEALKTGKESSADVMRKHLQESKQALFI